MNIKITKERVIRFIIFLFCLSILRKIMHQIIMDKNIEDLLFLPIGIVICYIIDIKFESYFKQK